MSKSKPLISLSYLIKLSKEFLSPRSKQSNTACAPKYLLNVPLKYGNCMDLNLYCPAVSQRDTLAETLPTL